MDELGCYLSFGMFMALCIHMETPQFDSLENQPDFEPQFETPPANISAAETLIAEIEEKIESGETISQAEIEEINEMVKVLEDAQREVPAPEIQSAIARLIALRPTLH